MTEQASYIAHKLRSHPFRCIYLPLILVFLIILYWFLVVPIVFNYYIKVYKPGSFECLVFMSVYFLIFVIILALLICLWRISTSKDKTNCVNEDNGDYTIVNFDSDILETRYDCPDNCLDDFDDPPYSIEACSRTGRPVLRLDWDSKEEQVVTRKHDIDFEERPLSQNLEVALTPRELFFRDLYENASTFRNSITRNFIQKEREYSSIIQEKCELWTGVDNGKVVRNGCDDNVVDNEKEVVEFFIASVQRPKSITSEAFIFVNEETGSSPKRISIQLGQAYAENVDAS